MSDALTEIAFLNLDLLNNLTKDDIVIGNRKKLSIINETDEYVQIDNINDIEYSIYFTFMRLFNLKGFNYLDRKGLYKKINIAIDNIYENTKLNEYITKDDELKNIIDDIEILYEYYSMEGSIDIFDNLLTMIKNNYNLLKETIKFHFNYQNNKKENRNFILKEEILDYLENRSAKTIQKYVRGMIVRKSM